MNLRQFDSLADEIDRPLPVVLALGVAGSPVEHLSSLSALKGQEDRAVWLLAGSFLDDLNTAPELGAEWIGAENLHLIDDRGMPAAYAIEPLVSTPASDSEGKAGSEGKAVSGEAPLEDVEDIVRRVAAVFGDRAMVVEYGETPIALSSALEDASDGVARYERVAHPANETRLDAGAPHALSMQVRRHVDSVLGMGPEELHAEILTLLPEFASAALLHSTLDLRHYKHGTLVRRIAQRVQVVGAASAEDYLAQLQASASEALVLVQSILIGVTSFFRDPDAFDGLADRMRYMITRSAANDARSTLRIWVPGCSTGEEAYSVAILATELLEEIDPGRSFQVFATDLNAAALVKARRGEYAQGIAENVSEDRLERHFEPQGDRWRIRESIRGRVLFSVHNLINDPPLNRMDLISCRNLMIYLGPHLQKKLFPLLHFALVPGGTLFLGSSESLHEHGALFDLVEERFNIAARRDVPSERFQPGYLGRGERVPIDSESDPLDLVELMRAIVMDEFVPASVVIDGDGQIRAASTEMNPFLAVGAGEFRNNILWLARPGLRTALRKGIRSSAEAKRRVVVDRVWMEHEDGRQQVSVTVQPMPTGGAASGLFIVVFNAVGLPLESDHAPGRWGHEETVALELELSKLRREYEDTVQRLESANEELKSGNEELISINEELRSTNHELNASKEEVQRAHTQLAATHAELENLLSNTEVAMIFLDRDERIMRFTPSATRVFNVLPGDIGRPLEHLTHRARRMPPLEEGPGGHPGGASSEDAEKGSGGSAPQRITLKDGSTLQRRIRPLTAADGAIIGKVLSFDDITGVDRARRKEKSRLAELREVYASAAVGLALVKSDLSIRSANEQFWSISKRAEGRVPLAEALPKDLFEGIAPFLDDVVAGRQTTFQSETRGRDHDGEWRSWKVTGRATSEDLDARGLTLAVDDITERVEAESRALKSRAFLRSIVDAVNAFIGVCDQNGVLTECNRQALEVLDVEVEAVVGRPFEKTLWWAHDEATQEIVRECVQRALAGESISRSLTYRTGSGQVRHLDFQANPMPDSAGNIHQAVVSGFDTEERFEAAERLRLANRRLEIVLRTLQVGRWWWDLSSGKVICDEAQREIFGLPREGEVTIDDAMARVLPEDAPELSKQLERSIETEETYKHRFRVRRTDGTVSWIGAEGEVVLDEETGSRALVGVNWDVTEEYDRETELEEARRQAEAANRAKSEFLANMSHEIRTPMTAILGYADILAKHLNDPDNTSLVETIRRNGRFLLEILNDILDLAKIESGAQPVEMRLCPPEQVIEDVASLMHVRAVEEGVTLDVEYGDALPLEIQCDPVRLRQVLLNLVGNALKFTEEGRVTLRTTTEGDVIRFAVVDTGIGIESSDLTRLFEPFTQADNSPKRKEGGTGLGLAISRRLCRAMGGELEAESTLGHGSTFLVTLPLGTQRVVERRVVAKVADPAGEVAEADTPGFEGRTVLIVDDRRDVRTLIQFLFEDAGAATLLASDGAEAVALFESIQSGGLGEVDLIVMDMQMPVMDGYVAATRLRELGCTLPIIAVTAHAMQGELEKCLAAGCSDYTTKPIDGDLLLRMAADLTSNGSHSAS